MYGGGGTIDCFSVYQRRLKMHFVYFTFAIRTHKWHISVGTAQAQYRRWLKWVGGGWDQLSAKTAEERKYYKLWDGRAVKTALLRQSYRPATNCEAKVGLQGRRDWLSVETAEARQNTDLRWTVKTTYTVEPERADYNQRPISHRGNEGGESPRSKLSPITNVLTLLPEMANSSLVCIIGVFHCYVCYIVTVLTVISRLYVQSHLISWFHSHICSHALLGTKLTSNTSQVWRRLI